MKSQITCPNCGTAIDVNDVLKHQLEDGIRKEYAAKELEAKKAFDQKADQLAKERAVFLEQKQNAEEAFQEQLEKALKSRLEAKEDALKRKLQNENSEQLEALNKELNEKSEKLKELNKSKAEIERLKREKNEMEEAIKADQERVFNQRLKEEQERIKKLAEESNELRLRELQKQLEDQKKLTEEMKRKQEQGSMQLQGEVQELAIEEWLQTNFPLDTIEEIKKGVNGADCVQIVNTYDVQNCGVIYYESKRAKNFSNAWIAKFKEDMGKKGAPVGVLVSEVLPNGMDRMGMVDENLWVCTYHEFKSLSAVLRQSVIEVNTAVVTQVNKGDKMAMLYDYLTSPEFRMQIEAIKDAFMEMQEDLNKEQRSTNARWKRRQKQIDKVMISTTGMYGSLRGIAGSSVPLIEDLEDGEPLEKLEEVLDDE